MRFSIALVVAILFLPSLARAQYSFGPAMPGWAEHGPDKANGAVIWNHGWGGQSGDASTSPPPVYLANLHAGNWDVFRHNRAGTADSYDRMDPAMASIAARMTELRQRGYKKIVLAGQSFGAWISIHMATSVPGIDSIIAIAPAAYGQDSGSRNFDRNAINLYAAFSAMKPVPLFLALFDRDGYDPGGRGERAKTLLGPANPLFLVDRPKNLPGHGAGNTALFAGRFGPCILAFIDARENPAAVPCPTAEAAAMPGELPMPSDLAMTAPATDAPAALAMLAGRWGGYLAGRVIDVAVERIEAKNGRFVYAYGPGSADGKPGLMRYDARIDGDAMIGKPSSGPTVTLKPRSDGKLNLRWESSNGRETYDAVLERR